MEKGFRKRRWRDGSLESDLPMMQLKELFNVNHFIVSQANPHIAPFLRFKDLVRAYGGDFAAKVSTLTLSKYSTCTVLSWTQAAFALFYYFTPSRDSPPHLL